MHRNRRNLQRILVPSLVLLLAATALPPSLVGAASSSTAIVASLVNLDSSFAMPPLTDRIPHGRPANKNVLVLPVDYATSLMRNLNAQLASRGGTSTVKAFADQAKLLIGLEKSAAAVKKTATAQGIDLTAYQNRLTSLLSHVPTLHPIQGTYAGYGWRINPILLTKEFHPADDVGAATGTPITAAAAGIVITAKYDSSGGNMTILDHGSVYMHCSKLLVSVGQTVSKGQVIGKVGMTGLATCPHLHFGISFEGTPFDPTLILQE